jgi:hypothetical protein
MGKRFIPLDSYKERWRAEATTAWEVYDRMSNGAVPGFLLEMDFHFVSNSRDNLVRLGGFLEAHYGYQIEDLEKHGWRRWCLNGKAGEIPITQDILLHWALDMFDRGFHHDAELEGYVTQIIFATRSSQLQTKRRSFHAGWRPTIAATVLVRS